MKNTMADAWRRLRPRAAAMRGNAIYYAAMLGAGGVGLVKSVGYGLSLAPSDFGFLSLVLSLTPFILFGISRGVLEGAALELPRLYGLKQNLAAAALLRRCLRRLYLECLVVLLAAVALLAGGFPVIVFFLAVPLAAATGVLSLVLTDLRSRAAIGQYGGAVLSRAVLCGLIGLPAAVIFGFKGAVVGEVAAQGLLLLWLIRSIPRGEAEPKERGDLSEVRARGWKMMVHQLLQLLQLNGDKWLISMALGPAALGQYSFAAIFLVAVALMHAIVYQQVGPAALRSLAEGESAHSVLQRVERWSLGLGLSVALLGALTGGVYWWCRGGLLAAYAEGFAVFPWIVLGGIFQAMNHMDWIVSTGSSMGQLALWDVASTIGFFAIGGLGIYLRWPLIDYAIMVCVARGISLFVSFRLARITVQSLAKT